MNLQKCFILLFTLLLFSGHSSGQKGTVTLSINAPIQYETQHVYVTYGPDRTEYGHAINFGFSGSANLFLSDRFSIGAGIGYFRQKFGIKRGFDWMRLNPSLDPVLLFIGTTSYDYHLFVFPLTASLLVGHTTKNIALNIEYLPGFALLSSYNNKKANELGYKTSHSQVHFFSHQLSISADFPFHPSKLKQWSVGPTIRVMNAFHEDGILFDDPNKVDMRYFDGFGVHFKYTFQLYRPKLP